MPLGDRRPEHCLGVRLDRVIERRHDAPPLALRRRADHVDRATERVAHDRLLPGLAGELFVVLDLEAAEPLVVGPRETDDLRAHRALRVGAPLFGVAVHADEVAVEELRGCFRVCEPLDVDEAAAFVQQLRVERIRVDAKQLMGRDGDGPWVHHLARVGVDRLGLLPDCELDARLVEDRSAAGRDDDRLVMLTLGHLPERCGVHALEPDGARECAGEDESESREQQADAAIGLPVAHRGSAQCPRFT